MASALRFMGYNHKFVLGDGSHIRGMVEQFCRMPALVVARAGAVARPFDERQSEGETMRW